MKIWKICLMGHFDAMCQTTHDCISTLAWGGEIAAGFGEGEGQRVYVLPSVMQSTLAETYEKYWQHV